MPGTTIAPELATVLNPLMTNRNRRALGDEWQRPSKGVGDGLKGSTLKIRITAAACALGAVVRATVSPAREKCRPRPTMDRPPTRASTPPDPSVDSGAAAARTRVSWVQSSAYLWRT